MKCCDISAGDLRTIITIERVTESADGQGGFTQSWAEDPAGGVYAKVTGLGGGERWQAMRVSPANRAKAVIRFRDDGSGAPYYSAGDRVKVSGRIYGVEYVQDVEFRRQWIEMGLVEGEPT